MSEPLISERLRIETKHKNDSISQIQHEQLRVSFSLLTILQNQDPKNDKISRILSKNTQNQEDFNRQYAQLPKVSLKTKKLTLSATNLKKTGQLPSDMKFRSRGQYFNQTSILTPKVLNANFSQKLPVYSRSSRLSLTNKSIKLKRNFQSRSFSKKTIKQNRNCTFDAKIRVQNKGNGKYRQIICQKNVKYLLSPRFSKNLCKSEGKMRAKSYNQIVIICHKQKTKKGVKKLKEKFDKNRCKQNISPYRASRNSRDQIDLKFRNKNQMQTLKKWANIAKISSDYWCSGVEVELKIKQKTKKLRSCVPDSNSSKKTRTFFKR